MSARLRGDVALPVVVLLALGLGWGLTQTLSKIAVSTGHGHFGLLAWQCLIGAAVLGTLLLLRGRRVPVGRAQGLAWILIALSGTVLPGIAFYQAVAHLPAGIMAILISLIPMIAFPLALAMRMERFSAARLGGLVLGLAGVALVVLPGTALPDREAAGWVGVALIAPAFYALEGVGVARWGTAGLDPVATLFGANAVGAALVLPLAWGTGQLIDPRAAWGTAEWAILAVSVLNALIYTGFVWLLRRAGATFATQVSYLITGFGVLWAMALLGERYGWSVWAALAVMLAGLFLVQPRPAPPDPVAATGAR